MNQLNSTLIYAGERLNATVDTVKNVYSSVDLAYKDSVSILRDISAVTLPEIDINDIKENSVDFLKAVSARNDNCVVDESFFFTYDLFI